MNHAAALTVLMHKPAQVAARTALQQAWPELCPGQALPEGLRQPLPLEDPASGLVVWSSDRGVLRRLLDERQPLEQEWLLSMPMSGQPLIDALRAQGMRASLGHEREGLGQWRVVGRAATIQGLPQWLQAQRPGGEWQLRRQRIGRLGLAPLAPGQARCLHEFEKF